MAAPKNPSSEVSQSELDTLDELGLKPEPGAGADSKVNRLPTDLDIGRFGHSDRDQHIAQAILAAANSYSQETDSTGFRLICMRMGTLDMTCHTAHYFTPAGPAKLKLKPFEVTPVLHPDIATSLSADLKQNPAVYGNYIKRMWKAPPVTMVNMETGQPLRNKQGKIINSRGTCKGDFYLNDVQAKQRIQSCVYGNCPIHPLPDGKAAGSGGPMPLFHSIWQGQMFVMSLRSPEVIQRYIQEVDNRREVAQFGLNVITHRQRMEIELLGVGRPNDKIIY